jgi:phosphoenolpyruvate-protein kinase (PTS system EI component)
VSKLCAGLVTRLVDADWIPTFACVAGVIIEMGGDLSHGSIMLRQIGLPAITNVSKVTEGIQTGDVLRSCGLTSTVERISPRCVSRTGDDAGKQKDENHVDS